ncbi:hypothetical protein BGZ79_004380, partial [Entomortierella chlamydospora]
TDITPKLLHLFPLQKQTQQKQQQQQQQQQQQTTVTTVIVTITVINNINVNIRYDVEHNSKTTWIMIVNKARCIHSIFKALAT